MKRLIAICIGLAWGGAAPAADPVLAYHQPAAASLRMASATDVTQPLPAAVATALPPPGAEYSVPHGTPGCVGTGCPSGECVGDGRTCLERLTDWFCFRPGPRVLPVCTPTPYSAPLRHYFPCHPGQCLAVGGCKRAGGCGTGGCGHANTPGLLAPATANGYVQHPVPAQTGTDQAQPTVRAARPTFRDRVMGVFTSAWSAPVYSTPAPDSGPTVVPAPSGHRFATPGMNQPSAAVRGGVEQTGHQQPSAKKPLTNQ